MEKCCGWRLKIPNIVKLEIGDYPQGEKVDFVRLFDKDVLVVTVCKGHSFLYRFTFTQRPMSHHVTMNKETTRVSYQRRVMGLRYDPDTKIALQPFYGSKDVSCVSRKCRVYGTNDGHIHFLRSKKKIKVFDTESNITDTQAALQRFLPGPPVGFWEIDISVSSLGFDRSGKLLFVGGVGQFCVYNVQTSSMEKNDNAKVCSGFRVQYLCASATQSGAFFFSVGPKLCFISRSGKVFILIRNIKVEHVVHVKPDWLCYSTSDEFGVWSVPEKKCVYTVPLKGIVQIAIHRGVVYVVKTFL